MSMPPRDNNQIGESKTQFDKGKPLYQGKKVTQYGEKTLKSRQKSQTYTLPLYGLPENTKLTAIMYTESNHLCTPFKTLWDSISKFQKKNQSQNRLILILNKS